MEKSHHTTTSVEVDCDNDVEIMANKTNTKKLRWFTKIPPPMLKKPRMKQEAATQRKKRRTTKPHEPD
jgi:hypothetical protein